jgi:LSD1 subclass zinc finger protein
MTDITVRGLQMPVMLLCPNLRCRKLLSVPDEVRGKTVKCQHCQTIVRVPEKALPAAAVKR